LAVHGVAAMVNVTVSLKDDDGAAWFDGDTIVINIRWLMLEEEAEWYVDESFIHEYIEHVLGLGHDAALFVEEALRTMLYREWFNTHPLNILYGGSNRGFSRPVHEVSQQYLVQRQGVQAPHV